MKVGIVGAGALGSIFAHYFHEHLIEFVIYEKNEETACAIQNSGLTMIKGDTARVIKPSISRSPEILKDAEIIFLFVKSYSTAEAVQSISKLIPENSIIVSLQNGLGNIEDIIKVISSERVVYGTTTIGAAKPSAAEVIPGGSGIINIGGEENGHVLRVHHLLNSAGLNSYIVENPDYYLWNKAVVNSGINPIAAILGITNGEILGSQDALKLQENIISECVKSANANNIEMNFTELLKTTREVCEKTSSNTCSMLQDLQYKRRTEIESINGKIIEYAENKGLDMPYNKTLYLLIKSMENIIP